MASNSAQSLAERRMVLVGGSGAGKSSLGNTLLCENLFTPHHYPHRGTVTYNSATKEVMNTLLTLIDTPGVSNTDQPEDDLKSELYESIVECDPGVHVFLIVLKVETYTKHGEEVIMRIFQCFSEEMLKYSVIVFTHGDQLKKGTTIQQFVDQNRKLKDLVRKCDGRCHVFDSKYWKNDDPEEKYRRNSYQLKDLLNTVERLVKRNNGDMYTNETLQKAEQIQEHVEEIRRSERDSSDEEIRKREKPPTTVSLGKTLVGCAIGVLLLTLFSAVANFAVVTSAVAGFGFAIFSAIALSALGFLKIKLQYPQYLPW